MVLVQLPEDTLSGVMKVGGADSIAACTYDHAEFIQNKLFYDYQIEASTQKFQPQYFINYV